MDETIDNKKLLDDHIIEAQNKIKAKTEYLFYKIENFGSIEAANEARQEYINETQSGGKYHGRGLDNALDDIEEKYLPGKKLEELKAKEIIARSASKASAREIEATINKQLASGELNMESLMAKHAPDRGRYYVPGVISDKWDLSKEMETAGAVFDNVKNQYYFTDQKKAQDAFHRINAEKTKEPTHKQTNGYEEPAHEQSSEHKEPTRHYIKERYYLEADAKDVKLIKDVLILPNNEGGLGFQFDEKRKQWFTYDPNDLEKAKKLMDVARENEKQGTKLNIKGLIDELRNIERETAHEM